MILDVFLFSMMAVGARLMFATEGPWPTDVSGWLTLVMVAGGALALIWRAVRKVSSTADDLSRVPQHDALLEEIKAELVAVRADIKAHTEQDERNFAAIKAALDTQAP